jgi:hypothetical protein
MDALMASAWGPLVIFCLRIVDVSLSTLRRLLSVRGIRLAAPLIGFFEVSIWITAVATAIRHLDSPRMAAGQTPKVRVGRFEVWPASGGDFDRPLAAGGGGAPRAAGMYDAVTAIGIQLEQLGERPRIELTCGTAGISPGGQGGFDP